MNDVDLERYFYEEAQSMRRLGWTVWPPYDRSFDVQPSPCIGVDKEGCPVRTPNRRCRFCNKTRRLRREARGWSRGGPRAA